MQFKTAGIDTRDVDGVNFTDVEDRVFDAGEGVGRIDAILADLLAGGYDGTIAIEPHMTGLAAMRDPSITPERVRADYVAYGRQLEDLIARARQGAGS